MLTLTAEALAESVRTDLHTFSHIPKEVRDSLSRLGVNVASSEEKDLFRVIDSFTVTTGIGIPDRRAGRPERYQSKSIRRLHLDDNLSVLAQYNDEKALIDYWRTRFAPWSRSLQLSVLHSLTTGVHSASFYNQFETLCDGIFDFQSREAEQGMEHYFRVRTIRGPRLKMATAASINKRKGRLRLERASRQDSWNTRLDQGSKGEQSVNFSGWSSWYSGFHRRPADSWRFFHHVPLSEETCADHSEGKISSSGSLPRTLRTADHFRGANRLYARSYRCFRSQFWSKGVQLLKVESLVCPFRRLRGTPGVDLDFPIQG